MVLALEGIKKTRTLEEVSARIEELRKELEELAEAKENADLEVIAASQALDVVLNEYYRILKKNSGK